MADRVINLAYTRKAATVRIPVVQYTTAPDIVFVLEDYTPTGTATIYIDKPSGEEIYNHCIIEGNNVRFTPTNQCFAEVGENKAQLQILNGNKIAVSFVIIFEVAENIIDSDAIESTSEFTELETAISTIGRYDDRMDQVEQEVADALVVMNDTIAAAMTELDEKIDGVIVTNPTTTPQVINGGLNINGEEVNINADEDVNIQGMSVELDGSSEITLRAIDLNIEATNITVRGTSEIVIGDIRADVGSGVLIAPEVIAGNIGATRSVSPSSTSLVNDTWAALGSVTLQSGVYQDALYMIVASGSFASNANGNRMMVVSNEAASGAAINNAFRDYKAPAPGATTTTQCIGFIIVPYMEERTIYVNGKQNSGSSLTASCRIHAVRLK